MDEAAKDEPKRCLRARVRLLRKAPGLRQEKVALKAGLDRSCLGAIERGENNVSLVNIHSVSWRWRSIP